MKNALISIYAAGAIAVLLLSMPLAAQVPPGAAQRPSVPELLADFEDKAQEPDYRGGAFDLHRVIGLMALDPERYPEAAVDLLLDGLEEVAIRTSAPRARHFAIIWIAEAGNAARSSPRPGTVARLRRIYERIRETSAEYFLIPRIRLQADRAEAIALLQRIAEDPRAHGGYHTPPLLAISELRQMEEDGRAALRELHTRGHVRDSSARHFLERLAAHDFRRPQR